MTKSIQEVIERALAAHGGRWTWIGPSDDSRAVMCSCHGVETKWRGCVGDHRIHQAEEVVKAIEAHTGWQFAPTLSLVPDLPLLEADPGTPTQHIIKSEPAIKMCFACRKYPVLYPDGTGLEGALCLICFYEL